MPSFQPWILAGNLLGLLHLHPYRKPAWVSHELEPSGWLASTHWDFGTIFPRFRVVLRMGNHPLRTYSQRDNLEMMSKGFVLL